MSPSYYSSWSSSALACCFPEPNKSKDIGEPDDDIETEKQAFKTDRESQMWSAGVLTAAALSFPLVATTTLAVAAYDRLTRPTADSTEKITVVADEKPKTCIVTGGKMTKALMVARQLKKIGCRVVLIETHKYWMVASRFASCVDRFVTVPVPEQEPEAYLEAIAALAREEKADLFVPVSAPVASVYDARVATVLPEGCRSLACSEELTAALDDKVTFAELAVEAGLPTPDTRRMTSKAQLHAFNDELRAATAAGATTTRFVLKNLAYDSMRRLDVFKLPCEPEALATYVSDVPITAETPWVVQEFLAGQEYSTCAIAYEGALTMYTDNEASISCFNYKYQGDARLRGWVEGFCKHHKVSGVVCIDFFIGPDGVAKAIECNPRFSSNITNFHQGGNGGSYVADAYLHPEKCVARGETITPPAEAEETCWTAVELWYALSKPGYTLSERAAKVANAALYMKDAYYDPDDVTPFLALHFVHIPTLLYRQIRKGNRWAKIDMCIGKLTEENGD